MSVLSSLLESAKQSLFHLFIGETEESPGSMGKVPGNAWRM